MWGLVDDRLRQATASTSSRREFVLAGHQSDTALQRLPGLLGARRSRGTEERILSAADGSCIALAAVGRAVHSSQCSPAGLIVPQPPPSLASDRRDKHPPMGPSLKIAWGYATNGAWHASLPQGLLIEGKTASWCRCCRLHRQGTWAGLLQLHERTSAGPVAVNLTGGRGFHSGTGNSDRLRRSSPCPRQPSLIELCTR